ncbi:DUF1516 family protein [Lactobacillaceae bacterium L1_55_11]|nr:DUF1516 family protein [Lactobacillaceae bacterium L1_55_11]
MYLWLHIILAVALIVLLVLDLRKTNGSLPIAMTIRGIYVVMIIDGIILLGKAWHRSPVLASAKVLFSLVVIGFIEVLMAKRARNQVTKSDFYRIAIELVLLIILGLFTAGFRPWIHLF